MPILNTIKDINILRVILFKALIMPRQLLCPVGDNYLVRLVVV